MSDVAKIKQFVETAKKSARIFFYFYLLRGNIDINKR